MPRMTPAMETASLAADQAVHPAILAVMLVAFLIGAVGPFAVCVIGSIREERAMRRRAAAAKAAGRIQSVDNPVDPVVAPAAAALTPAALDVVTLEPANDEAPAPVALRN